MRNTLSKTNISGRKTVYKPEYALRARELCRLGGTTFDLAIEFHVPHSQILSWQAAHEEFSAACNAPLEAYDERVGRSLATRALGYDYYVQESVRLGKKVVIVEVRKHMPADVAAMKYWLDRRGKVGWVKPDAIDPDVLYKQVWARMFDAVQGNKFMPNEDQQPWNEGRQGGDDNGSE